MKIKLSIYKNKRKNETINNLANHRRNILKKYIKSNISKYLNKYKLNMNKYLYNLSIDGVVKKYPEDFIVEEITKEGILLEYGKSVGFKDVDNWNGTFIHFTLEKINWNTIDAIGTIAKHIGYKRKNFGFAGTKDKFAITTQRVGSYGVKIGDLKRINIKGITIRDIQKTNEKLRLGDLWGNRFTIRVRLNDNDNNDNNYNNNYNITDKNNNKINNKNNNNKINKNNTNINKLKNLKIDYVINYYGIQRFGTFRPITHIVGKFIYERDFESAFYLYCGTPLSKNSPDYEGRKLVDEENFKECLKVYPRNMHYERRMIKEYLKSNDYKKAFNVLPPQLKCMFVNAYQSYLFNEIINKRYEYGFKPLKGDILKDNIPTGAVFGYKIKLSDGIQGEIEREVIKKENIDLKKFKIENFGNFQGDRRKMIMKVYDFKYWMEDNAIVLSFKLEKGNYATSVLREIIKDKGILR